MFGVLGLGLYFLCLKLMVIVGFLRSCYNLYIVWGFLSNLVFVC